MTEPTTPAKRFATLIVWTNTGLWTSVAALILMLGVFMVALGATDEDLSEGVFGYVLGAAGLIAWAAVAIVAGRALVRGRGGKGRLLGLLPAIVSVAWCGLAAALLAGGFLDLIVPLSGSWPSALGPFWGITFLTLTTAGAVPIGVAFLIVNVVFRILRSRQVAEPEFIG